MPTTPRGPLQAPELAAAAVLGGLAVALTIFGWFVPYASAVGVLPVVPMAIVGYRCRIRAVLASGLATAGISFLVAGTGPLSGVLICVAAGGLVGIGHRRSWGAWRTFGVGTFIVAPLLSLLAVGVLAALPSLRKLALEQISNALHGLTKVVVRFLTALNLQSVAEVAKQIDHAVNVAIRFWWLTIPALVSIGLLALTVLTWFLCTSVFSRLDTLPAPDLLGDPDDSPATGSGGAGSGGAGSGGAGSGGGAAGSGVCGSDDVTPEPVPVVLESVSYRYAGASSNALSNISLRVEPASLLTVVGNNGSGKSTLVRLLAGRPPTSGRLTRPGSAGLGRLGGTALVSQRPESQVLGIRVADDVTWGLPVAADVEVSSLLDAVGLTGMEDRDTSTLSGGELQRLAMAAALAHRPRLLLSDESTAMVDGAGRQALTELLADLPTTRGVSVVHVTHRMEEAVAAHAMVRLERGVMIPARLPAQPATASASGWGTPAAAASVVAGAYSPGGPPASVHFARGPVVAGAHGALDGGGARAGLAATPDSAWGAEAGTAGERWSPGRILAEHQLREAIRSWGFGAIRRPPGTPVLRVAGVSHTYSARTPWARRALADVDFEVGEGEGVLVVGGNGSGKSTLAWVMAGLTRPTVGVCLVDGVRVSPSQGRVGLAFQHSRLQLQRASVRVDVCNAANVDNRAADAALALVGLDPAEMGDRSVDRLSGGQMRRVALAGILARRPRLLILDEPMAGLDGPSREGLCRLLATLRAEVGLTLIVISHDLEGMGAVCDRKIELREGRVMIDVPLGQDGSVRPMAVPAAHSRLLAPEFSARSTANGGVDSRTEVPSPPAPSPAAPAAHVATPLRSADRAPRPVAAAPRPPAAAGASTRSPVPATPRRRRRPRSVVLLRQVGGGTPVHRLWAGTKLLAVAALSLTLSIHPTWSSTALVAATVVGAALLARIPRGTVPRLPLAFWAFLVLGAAFTLVSGGKPFVTIGGTQLGLGDLESYALFTLLSLVLFGASLIIGWTTPASEIAPALVTLGRPLRFLRLPVEEWAVTMALAIRSLPLLLDELRTLVAARRLRPGFVDSEGRGDRIADLIELCAAALVVALRRADEMGDAIRVRGGTTNFAASARKPARRDAVALAIVAVLCAGAFLLPS